MTNILGNEITKYKGKKFQDKKYYRHTGYPGGIKEITPEKLSEISHTGSVTDNCLIAIAT